MIQVWPCAPSVRRGPAPLSLVTILTSAAIVAVVGPVVRAASLPASQPRMVATTSVAATLAVLVVPRRMWWARLLIALATGMLLFSSQGHTIALWVAAGLALAPWVTRDRPPLPLLPKRGTLALVPCLALMGVAAWVGMDPVRTKQVFVPLALACVLPLVTPLITRPMAWLTRSFDRVLTSVVEFVAFPILAVVAIVPVWAAQRTLRIEPRQFRTGWTARDRRPVRPTRLWVRDAAHDPPPPGRRARVALAFASVVALVLVGFWFSRPDPPEPYVGGPADRRLIGEPSARGALAAHEGDAWYPAYHEDITWILNEKVAVRPFELYNLWDVKTRTVNIVDNRRVSWEPPACECRRLTVWLYGGGGAFGFEQRDDHTIASELARIAAENGFTVDVLNRGLPGQNHEQTATRFAWDLAGGDKPDLAIFYEGAEEVVNAEALNDPPVGNLSFPYDESRDGLWNELHGYQRVPPPEAEEYGFRWPSVPTRTPTEVGELAAATYSQTLGLSDDSAAGYDVPVQYFWEPTRYTRPGPEAPSASDPDTDARRTSTFAAAAAALPDRVTDLSDVFADVPDPLYADAVHPNERGARLIAAAIFESIRDELAQLQGGQD